MLNHLQRLLQLASPALPVGGYCYSEGLESAIAAGKIANGEALERWLDRELIGGTIRVEAALLLRAYEAIGAARWEQLYSWNDWLSATRETTELRGQSYQMGESLMRLASAITPNEELMTLQSGDRVEWNYAIAFGITAWCWEIPCDRALEGFLHSWIVNLIGAGIKLIPLGQTAGQQILWNLHPRAIAVAADIPNLSDDDLESCSWGLALSSMAHESQYTRLFRS